MKRISLVTGLLTLVLALFSVTSAPIAAATGNTSASCSHPFLTFPAWYRGLTTGPPDCGLKSPGDVGLSKFIWTIVLNLIDILLQLVGYVSVGFIIYGGFIYLTSAGYPDKATAARKTLINAIIGLVLSFLSVAIVTLVSGNI